MPELVRAVEPILRRVAAGAFALGLAAFITGIAFVAFVAFGATGETKVTLFGQQLSTTSVGIAAMFLGVVPVTLLVRRVLRSLDHAVGTESPQRAKPSRSRRRR